MRAIFIICESCVTTFISIIFGFDELLGWPPGATQNAPWTQGGLWVTPIPYFSFSNYTKQLLFVKFCDQPAGNEVSFRTHKHRRKEGQTDVEVEMVI